MAKIGVFAHFSSLARSEKELKMSRKSKKGFKRLENHELTEFTTLNGGGAGDSESEDLLDLTGAHEHEAPDRCNR